MAPRMARKKTGGRQNLLHPIGHSRSEVTAGFEPAMGVLQTPALPLGYVTWFCGAEDEIRTRDPLLGKEMLYR